MLEQNLARNHLHVELQSDPPWQIWYHLGSLRVSTASSHIPKYPPNSTKVHTFHVWKCSFHIISYRGFSKIDLILKYIKKIKLNFRIKNKRANFCGNSQLHILKRVTSRMTITCKKKSINWNVPPLHVTAKCIFKALSKISLVRCLIALNDTKNLWSPIMQQ